MTAIDSEGVGRRAGFALAALGLGAFAFVTTETMPIGLLPQLAGAFAVSLPVTGLLVTIYALIVALTSAPLTALTARVPRGRLLCAVLGALVATTVGASFARSYPAFFAFRIVTAIAQAIFWSTVGSCAVRLVPTRLRGMALATIFSGVSLATVIGVPAATFVGQHVGWRAAFGGIAAIAAVVLVIVALTVRDDARSTGNSLANVRVLLGRGAFRSLVATTALVVLGQLVAFTYIVPFAENVAGFPAWATAPLLVAFGVAGAVGNVAAGAIANRNPVAASLAMTAAIAAALSGLACSGDHRVLAAALIVAWGFGAGGLAVGLQTRVLALAPDAPDLASSLFAAAFNVGIGGGALLGGAIVNGFGLARVVPVGAALAILALTVQAVSALRRDVNSEEMRAPSP